ncbi:hypothetical protein LJC56_06670 [Christensenellaceae bacterium OttesenSCG-928-K19]|nr:hypothetical protein [Christensenellaceae bacterium OttesenSCG-928-K19]
MKYDVDKMLSQAFDSSYFEDVAKESIWQQAQQKTAHKRKTHWIPVIAGATAAIVFVMAMPPVRAAVLDFFTSVADYMSTPPEDRQAVAYPEVQSNVMRGEPTVEQADLAGGADWIYDLGPLTVTEALYDGDRLYLNYTLDKGSADVSHILGNDLSTLLAQAPTGETMQIQTLGNVAVRLGNEFLGGSAYAVTEGDNTITVSNVFGDNTFGLGKDASMLDGAEDLTFYLYLENWDIANDGTSEILVVPVAESGDKAYNEEWQGATVWRSGNTNLGEGYSGTYATQGRVAVPIKIKTDSSMAETVTNQRREINGYGATVEHVRVKPYEINASILVENSDGFGENLRFEMLADGQILKEKLGIYLTRDGISDTVKDDSSGFESGQAGLYEVLRFCGSGNHAVYFQFSIPFPDENWRELTLLPYNESTDERYTSGAITVPLQ